MASLPSFRWQTCLERELNIYPGGRFESLFSEIDALPSIVLQDLRTYRPQTNGNWWVTGHDRMRPNSGGASLGATQCGLLVNSTVLWNVSNYHGIQSNALKLLA